jgi:hypothetical protein
VKRSTTGLRTISDPSPRTGSSTTRVAAALPSVGEARAVARPAATERRRNRRIERAIQGGHDALRGQGWKTLR